MVLAGDETREPLFLPSGLNREEPNVNLYLQALKEGSLTRIFIFLYKLKNRGTLREPLSTDL